MRVVLVDPATRFATLEPYENLGLAYLAATLRANGHHVKIVSVSHQNLSIRQAVRQIISFDPQLVGITILGANVKRAVALVHKLRESGYEGHVTLGGYYPTFHSVELMRGFPAIDSVVRNEGEGTLLDLVDHLPDGDLSPVLGLSYREGATLRETEQRPFTRNLDDLPFPARDFTAHVLEHGSYIHVSTSRGCYAKCSFCSIAKFFRMGNGKVWRRRSAESLAEEVESLARRFHFNKFKFIDDQFILTNKEGHQFAEEFGGELGRRRLKINFQIACRANNIERELFQRLKDIGLEKVFVGVESAHQRGLDTFDKETTVEMNNVALATLRELDLMYDVGFILVDPYTTYDELKQNLEYLMQQRMLIKKRGSHLSVTNMLIAYGGTPIYDRLVAERVLLGDYYNGFYYQVKDKEVRRFLFVMERILEGLVFPVHRRYLFWKRDLRVYLRRLALRIVEKLTSTRKGGDRNEGDEAGGLHSPHAAGVEPRGQYADDNHLTGIASAAGSAVRQQT